MRYVIASCVAAALLFTPAIASAQFGIGARIASVKADNDGDTDSVRFTGGQIRLLGGRWGLEASMDRHTESFDALNQKITDTPIQLSLLMRTGTSKVSPFVLGGRGWYRRKVSALEGDAEDIETSETGWHFGGGLEIMAGRRLGLHGDYRYTFIGEDEEDEDDDGLLGGFFPGRRGSMWTIGATFYF
jgi:opacity protein-like surface antigen